MPIDPQKIEINTTTEEIKSWINEVTEKLQSDSTFIMALDNNVESQKKIERKWLTNDENVKKYVSPFRMNNELIDNSNEDERFLDCNFLISSGCFANSLIGVNGNTSLEAVDKFANFISGFEPSNDNFLIKCPKIAKDEQSRDIAFETMHETVVGIFGTNQLRLKIPNFPYVYGAVNVTDPVNGELSYQIIENVKPYITMTDFCKKTNANDFFSIFLQIVYSLKTAKEVIGFTHYDLHTDNVLLKEFGMDVFIPYDEGSRYVKTDKLAVIVDYGRSHVLLCSTDKRKNSFGCLSPSLIPFGIFRDRIFPISDIYKFLLFCLKTMKEYGNSTYKSLAHLLKYFNQTEELENIIEDQYDLYYTLPPTQRTRGYNLEDFIDFMVESKKWEIDEVLIQSDLMDQNSNILPCGYGVINYSNPGMIIDNKKCLPFSYPSSFKGVFDIHACMTQQNNRETRREFSKNFIKGFTSKNAHLNEVIAKTLGEIDAKYDKLLKDMVNGNFSYLVLPSSNILELLNSRFSNEYSKTIDNCSIFFVALSTVVNDYNALKYITSVYWADGKLPDEINNTNDAIVDFFAKVVPHLKEIYKLISDDALILVPEIFGKKPSQNLLEIRKREDQALSYILKNIEPLYRFSSNILSLF